MLLGFVMGAVCRYGDLIGNKTLISKDKKQKVGCEWLRFACIMASLSMAPLYIIFQTRMIISPLFCPFLSKLPICTPCVKVLFMQGSQNVHNMHLSNDDLPEKAVIYLLKGFQYTESSYDYIGVKHCKMLIMWRPRSSALVVLLYFY